MDSTKALEYLDRQLNTEEYKDFSVELGDNWDLIAEIFYNKGILDNANRVISFE